MIAMEKEIVTIECEQVIYKMTADELAEIKKKGHKEDLGRKIPLDKIKRIYERWKQR